MHQYFVKYLQLRCYDRICAFMYIILNGITNCFLENLTCYKFHASVLASFEDCLVASDISVTIRRHYIKLLQFYLAFCSKYRHDANNSDSIIAFQKSFLRKNKVKGNGNRLPMQSAFTSMSIKQILLTDRRVFFLFLLSIMLRMPIP